MVLKYNPLLTGKLDLQTVNLSDLEDVNTAGTADGKVLSYQSGTWIPAAAAVGDMLKSVYVTGQGTVYNASRLEGETLATVQAHGVDAGTITQGTIGLARIPTMDDVHIPYLNTLSYSDAFGTAQIPSVGAYKIASGTLNADRIPALPTARITTGTFNSDRIPILPTDRYGSAVLVSGERTLTANLNFGSHEAVNIQLEQLGTHPAAARGRIYYNTTDDKIYVHIGTA